MIALARKDLVEALKWSRRYSPVAYLVLSMNGKWGTRKDNALNIVESFKRLWPETRAYLKTLATISYKGGGRILASDLEINYPQPFWLKLHAEDNGAVYASAFRYQRGCSVRLFRRQTVNSNLSRVGDQPSDVFY